MNDIYALPAAELAPEKENRLGDISVFKRFNTLYTIALSFLTLGLYFPYWLYTRTKKLNQIARHRTSSKFTGVTVAAYLVTYLLYFAQAFFEETDNDYGLLQGLTR